MAIEFTLEWETTLMRGVHAEKCCKTHTALLALSEISSDLENPYSHKPTHNLQVLLLTGHQQLHSGERNSTIQVVSG